MNTVYDWITVALFAGLVVLFLNRSNRPPPHPDALWRYILGGAGCAGVNWLGNAGHHALACIALAVLAGYIRLALRPFDEWRR